MHNYNIQKENSLYEQSQSSSSTELQNDDNNGWIILPDHANIKDLFSCTQNPKNHLVHKKGLVYK